MFLSAAARCALPHAAYLLWFGLLLGSTSGAATEPSAPAPDEQVDAPENEDGEQNDDDDGDVVECNEQDEECDDDDDDVDEADVSDATDRRLREMKTRAQQTLPSLDKPTSKEDAAFASWVAAPPAACVGGVATTMSSSFGFFVAMDVGFSLSSTFAPSRGGGGPSSDPNRPSLPEPNPAQRTIHLATHLAAQGIAFAVLPLLVVPLAASAAALLMDVPLLDHAVDVAVVAAAAAAVAASAGVLSSLLAPVPLWVYDSFLGPPPAVAVVAGGAALLTAAAASGFGVWWAVRGLHEETAVAAPTERKRVVSSTTTSTVSPAGDAMLF